MKNSTLFTILFLCVVNIPFSNAQQVDFDTDYQERLFHLGKVWGYIKYFHPRIVECRENWDEALVNLVPAIKQADTDAEFNQLLIDMFDAAGPIPETEGSPPEVDEDLRYNLNLAWFDDPIFSSEVKERLGEVRDNFLLRKHCRVQQAFSRGNPTFEVDNWLYEASDSPIGEVERVLSIFRYWNIINYFFPYKYQMDQDWDATLLQFIPHVVGADDDLSYHLSMKEMTTYINDGHGFFNSLPHAEWLGFYLAPFRLKYVEGQTVITKVHSSVSDKIKPGDIISAIDGQPIQEVRDGLRKYTEGSNPPSIERNINSSLLRGVEGQFELSIKNEFGDQTIELDRKRYNDISSLYDEPDPESYYTIDAKGGCEFGYVDMEHLTTSEVPNMFAAFDDLPAIVIDIRNYPQGTMWPMLEFLFNNPINFCAFTSPNITHPGTLIHYQYSLGEKGTPYEGKLIILFDEDTQSQAEFSIMALERHPGAIKIGSQTAGADGNVSSIWLPGGIQTYFSGLGVFYPDGTETQRVGIQPDLEFHPTIEGIRAGRDEMLELALDCELLDFDPSSNTNLLGINAYPNPVENNLQITNAFNDVGYNVIVTDAAGRFIENIKVNSSVLEYSVDMSGYAKGLYFLSFRNEEEILTTKKIVKY